MRYDSMFYEMLSQAGDELSNRQHNIREIQKQIKECEQYEGEGKERILETLKEQLTMSQTILASGLELTTLLAPALAKLKVLDMIVNSRVSEHHLVEILQNKGMIE